MTMSIPVWVDMSIIIILVGIMMRVVSVAVASNIDATILTRFLCKV